MADSDPAVRVRAALDRLAGDLPALGIALSGGGDSMALMQIAADWADGRRLLAVTVDHGLRPESAAEAQAAGHAAKALGIGHEVLRWDRRDHSGNLMAQARGARMALMADWAGRHGVPAVALGHTADDQAETLLMRLLRGAGIDGLAAMAETRRDADLLWLRPMLGVGRAELRDWLSARGIGWVDDPSNDNPDFDRIRMRQLLDGLGDRAALAQSARHLAEARAALAHYAALAAQGATADRGSLTLPLDAWTHSPTEIRRRLLVAAIRWITGADYPPRRATLTHALQALTEGRRVTLDGAILTPGDGALQVIREPAAALRTGAKAGPVWDNRWRIEGLAPGDQIAALGTAALDDLDWRQAGLDRDAAAATPAILRDGRRIAAPVIRPDGPIRALPLREIADFHALIRAR